MVKKQRLHYLLSFSPSLYDSRRAEINSLLADVHASRTRLLLDAAPNRGVERKKKIGPQFGPDVGRPTSVWDHPG
jgi:hypothetical protein